MSEKLDKNIKILLTGGFGFLGKHVYQELLDNGFENVVRFKTAVIDLRLKGDCEFVVNGMDVVIHLAAKVGGIGYNKAHPGSLIYDNLLMGANLIEAAKNAKVKKFLQIGTVCSYPKIPEHIPFKETDLWKGYPEETNAPYGLAKLLLLEMLQAYRKEYGLNGIYLLQTNLYGEGDNFNPESSHVIPALIKKFLEAQDKVEIWGTGKATRDFLYVKDAARAIVLAMKNYNKPEPVNLASHKEISIKQLVDLIAKITGFKGKIVWDKTKPDGQPRRKLDITKAKKFGFTAKTDFEIGLKKTIDWYLNERTINSVL